MVCGDDWKYGFLFKKGVPMNRVFFTFCVAASVALLGFCGQASADTIPYAYNPANPIFEYNFFDGGGSSSNLSTGMVLDLSSAGNNATGYQFTDSGLSTNVPAGMTGYSMNAGTTNDGKGLRTNGTQLMTVADVAQYGGFIYDAWIYPTSGAATWGAFIISFAGTDSIRLGTGATPVVTFNTSNLATSDNLISSRALTLNQWYHVQAVFDTMDNEMQNGVVGPHAAGDYVKGKMILYVNDVQVAAVSALNTRHAYIGYDRDQPFGIGVQPEAGSTSFDFAGLIYNPKVSYLKAIPEPSALALLGCGLLGLLAYAWRRRR